VRAGDTATFRATVVDSEGCPTGVRPQWHVVPGPLAGKASVDGYGTLSVDPTAPEGTLEIIAGVSGKAARATVEVVSASQYDALLASGRSADGGTEDPPASTSVASGTLGGGTAIAEDSTRRRKILFVVIASAVAVFLAAFGLVATRRGAPTTEGVPLHEDPDPASIPPQPSGFGDEGNRGLPPSGTLGRAAADASPGTTPNRGRVCPTCGERYGADAEFCGRDATKLFPIN
jgi:hypothetical protein